MTNTNETQTKRLRILLVEDKPHHLEDARKVLEERASLGLIEVDYATNYEEAQSLLRTNQYSGIMSDVFMPRSKGGLEEQIGIEMGEYAIKNNIPFVLVTDTNHHGTKTQPVCDYVRARNMELIDNQGMPGKSTEDAKHKNWKGAYMVITYLINRFVEGTASFGDGKIIGTPGSNGSANPTLVIKLPYMLVTNMDYNIRNCILLNEFQKFTDLDPHFKNSFERYCQGLFDEELKGEKK